MAIKIRPRRDTGANWTAADPVLDLGEMGIETDHAGGPKPKIGDGVTAWSSLPYLAADGEGVPVGGTAGQVLAKIDATDFNTEWVNAATGTFQGALVTPPAVEQSIPHSTATAIIWDTEDYDVGGFFDVASPTRLTIPAGVSRVRLSATVRFAANTTGSRAVHFRRSGVKSLGNGELLLAPDPVGGSLVISTVSPVISVSVGDYFETFVFQNSGAPLDTDFALTPCSFGIEVVE